mmetsp:Transcript_17915/g.30471  ORF Transcript_17915/g.30471 Transcript_17915/m.30471 type:complete len:154 (+) Transcript_17915:210-671(+)|eukprot:CAMPEP_0168623324 /NCGR_PEP_ID=MMETSP0449_2-20121227/8759_1 /TAXON_ID=1082188 /ORGANISM="Strombidium rassoulzadegani, Strain ras09" /LENGTH=153 /DNA_ID=CAMNT_0008664687 /DNA_START=127 /DNA_END=588 /DNA_ORIENTATION=+
MGAKKIYGIDISSEMIDQTREKLEGHGLGDKFELICADIFDSKFELPEKVDGVIMSYVLTTFIASMDMARSVLSQCKKMVKEGGFVLLADFQYVDIPQDNFWAGMYTKRVGAESPKEFEPFHFFIENAPESPFQIIHIPCHLMFRAGHEAGFN